MYGFLFFADFCGERNWIILVWYDRELVCPGEDGRGLSCGSRLGGDLGGMVVFEIF